MRCIRYRDSEGIVRVALEQPADGADSLPAFLEANEPDSVGALVDGFTPSNQVIETDAEILSLAPGFELLTPLEPTEVWCAGLNYPAIAAARAAEAQFPEPLEGLVADRRPDFHLKDAGGWRTVGSGQPIAIRGDSTWTVPEPELGLVVGRKGAVVGYTIGNNLVSRDIRGANPYYLTQATSYRASLALGPAIYVEPRRRRPFTIFMQVTDEDGRDVFADRATTKDMWYSAKELLTWLEKDNPLPPGAVVLTGAAIVPPDDFVLQAGHTVEIHVPEIGTLWNPVALVAELDVEDRLRIERSFRPSRAARERATTASRAARYDRA